jgi:hypothetical protein
MEENGRGGGKAPDILNIDNRCRVDSFTVHLGYSQVRRSSKFLILPVAKMSRRIPRPTSLDTQRVAGALSPGVKVIDH